MNDQITTAELSHRLLDPGMRIIDIRPADTYNGWTENGHGKGGHVLGARNLPLKWLNYIDWIEIVRSKNITPGNTVVLYGDDPEGVEKVKRRFNEAGYPDVKIYEHYEDEWVPRRHPVQKLERYRHLVPSGWLDLLIRTGSAPHYDNPNGYVLCHAHYRNLDDYEEGHIEGAIELDTNYLESEGDWNRRSPEELRNALCSLGISHDKTVILYGRFSYPDPSDPFPGSNAGQLAAFRCAFIMMYAGVKDVRVLNGGLQSWTDEGYTLTTKTFSPRPVEGFGTDIPANPGLAVDLEEAAAMIESPEKNLVCVRSWPEYIGETSGYNYIEKKGRIPGAVYSSCGSSAYHMEDFRNLDHTTREFHEVERNWLEAGIRPEHHNAFYCGTGWRGSEAFFNAWLMGWPSVSVFDGGWLEWSNNDYPFETGIPGQE